MSKTVKIECPGCFEIIEINPASLLSKMGYEGSTPEERKARTAKATKSRWLSPVLKKKVLHDKRPHGTLKK